MPRQRLWLLRFLWQWVKAAACVVRSAGQCYHRDCCWGRSIPIAIAKLCGTASRQLHDAFKAANGATCCRVLSKKVRHDKKAHFQQCSGLTAQAAEMAARLVLEKRPELVARVNNAFLNKRQSVVGGALLRLVRLFSG